MTFDPFYPKQPGPSRKKYTDLITGIAQLSSIYSDSDKPYLEYRSTEKMFCEAFSAENKTRQDVSVDAVKLKDGIGIKTFVSSSNVNKYEKIAEFVNREKYPLNNKDFLQMIKEVAEYRNKRIEDTLKLFDINNTVYHYLVRSTGKIHICECPLISIDLDSIELLSDQSSGNKVRFKDKNFDYFFHLTKHTLFKNFEYADPFDTLEISSDIDEKRMTWAINELLSRRVSDVSFLLNKYEYVVLPLYSTTTEEVPEKSGLNQWNASGRQRNCNELYIPIPKVVHERKPGFFPPRDHKFTLLAQDGKSFSAKVCQDNSKALMTDPNRDLGKWLLRDMLQLKEGELATLEHLRRKDSDTVIVYKLGKDEYQIGLHSLGGFEREHNN